MLQPNMYLINMKISCFCFSPLFIYLTHKRLKCLCLALPHVRKQRRNEENQKSHSFPCANDVRSMFDASLALLSAWLWRAPNTHTEQYVRRMRVFFYIIHLSLVGGALKCHDYTVALCVCALLIFDCDDGDNLMCFQLVPQHFSRLAFPVMWWLMASTHLRKTLMKQIRRR